MKRAKVSMQYIADQLGISKNSVSLALNGRPGVSEETREQVMQLAGRLGYTLPGGRTGEKHNILVLIPEYIRDDRYFYNDIYWEIDNCSARSGLSAIMSVVTARMEQQKELPPVCNELSFSGVLTIGILSSDYMGFLEKKFSAIVSVDHCCYGRQIPCVVTANINGSYTLTREVIRRGHKKIGFVGPVSTTDSVFERWCGFQLAMNEEGLVCDRYNIKNESPLGILLSDAGEMKEILREMKELPTAFVCGGDRIAIACINALTALGLRVPEDISVVGFDDIEISQFVVPRLTTMHIRRHHMARAAVAELTRLIHRQNCSQKTCLYAEFVERESLGDCAENR